MSNTMNGGLSFFGNRPQMWGLSGSMINTEDLIEMELSMLRLKSVPVENQIGYYEQELRYWESLKSTFTRFQDMTDTLHNLADENKHVSMSQEGFATISATSDALETRYSLDIDTIATAHKVLSDSLGDPTETLGISGSGTINGKEITLTEEMSLNDVAEIINGDDYGATASIINGTMILTAMETGQENAIQFESENGLFESLGFVTSEGAVRNEVERATDAIVRMDGVEVRSASNTLQDVISGVTITLTRETAEPIAFGVERNEEAFKETVHSFVNEYNRAIMTINEYTGKGAVLQGERIATEAKSMLNRALSTPTDSSIYLYQVGIEMNSVAQDGTTVLDEAKLMEQLDENPEEVFNLLVGENSFSEKVFQIMDRLIQDNGSLDTKIDGIEPSIGQLEDTLMRYEDSYIRQQESILRKYAQYESMMAQINVQNQFLTAQLEALNQNND